MTDPILLAGSANPVLARAVARELALPLGACTIERFPDGELTVRLDDSVRRREVFVIQPVAPPVNDHLIELIAFADACRRAAAARIIAVIPYLGYARSDKRGERREPVMASAVAEILQATGIDHVIVAEPHSPQVEGYFHIPIDAVTAAPALAASVAGRIPDDAVIVAPDAGAVRRAQKWGELIERPVIVIHKRRETARETVVTHVVGDVENRAVLIVDDMISTGGTIRRAIDALLAAGAREEIWVAATHGLFLEGAREKLSHAAVREIVVTDSIAQTWERVTQVSIAPVLAAAMRRVCSA